MFTRASVRERDRDQVASLRVGTGLAGAFTVKLKAALGKQEEHSLQDWSLHLFCSASLGCSVDVRFFHTSISYG